MRACWNLEDITCTNRHYLPDNLFSDSSATTKLPTIPCPVQLLHALESGMVLLICITLARVSLSKQCVKFINPFLQLGRPEKWPKWCSSFMGETGKLWRWKTNLHSDTIHR